MKQKPNTNVMILCYWNKYKSLAYVNLETGLTVDEDNNYVGAIYFELSVETVYSRYTFEHAIRAPFAEYKVKSAINRIKRGLQEHDIDILQTEGESELIREYPDYTEIYNYGIQVLEERQKGEAA